MDTGRITRWGNVDIAPGQTEIDPATVRWHVVTQRYRGLSERLPDRIDSFATIQDALAFIGHCTATPVIPCNAFAACEHCAAAMTAEGNPPCQRGTILGWDRSAVG